MSARRARSVAVLGYSNIPRDSLDGYKSRTKGTAVVDAAEVQNFGGGTWTNAADPNWVKFAVYWAEFDAQFQNNPIDTLWWGMVGSTPRDESVLTAQDKADIETVYNRVRTVFGGPIYATAQHGYPQRNYGADDIGPWGPECAQNAVNYVVDEKGWALRGPVFPSLRAGEIAGDNLHPNADGDARFGKIVYRFFDQNIALGTKGVIQGVEGGPGDAERTAAVNPSRIVRGMM